MALSNLVFTPGNAPDHTADLLKIVANKPDVYGAFSKGYDDQQKRELALQQYREAKLKADLAQQLYPYQSQLQIAMLQARLNALNGQSPYVVSPSAIKPINTAPAAVPTSGNGGTTAPVAPPVNTSNPDNPFNGTSPSLFQDPRQMVPQQNAPMIPGLADTTENSDNYIAGNDASPYSAGDFYG